MTHRLVLSIEKNACNKKNANFINQGFFCNNMFKKGRNSPMASNSPSGTLNRLVCNEDHFMSARRAHSYNGREDGQNI